MNNTSLWHVLTGWWANHHLLHLIDVRATLVVLDDLHSTCTIHGVG